MCPIMPYKRSCPIKRCCSLKGSVLVECPVRARYTLQIEDVKLGRAALAKYGLEAAATKLEPTNEVPMLTDSGVLYLENCSSQVDAKFVAELILVKQTMEQVLCQLALSP